MVDYSKWKNIEVSDDEGDTPSFDWKLEARVKRLEQIEREQLELVVMKKNFQKKYEETMNKLATEKDEKIKKKLEETLKTLTVEEQELKDKEEVLKLKQKVLPWIVDTMSKPGVSKTTVNTPKPLPSEENKTIQNFVDENMSKLKTFGMLRKYKDSLEYLQKNPQLVCEITANYLLVWCDDLQKEGKTELVERVSHQIICMKYIFDCVRMFDVDPQACASSFFMSIPYLDKEHMDLFNKDVAMCIACVQKKAEERTYKTEDGKYEVKVELGPGGLDPVEVFESFPDELKKCFESDDAAECFKDTIKSMDPKKSDFYMKQCLDSGLLSPDTSEANNDAKHGDDAQEENT